MTQLPTLDQTSDLRKESFSFGPIQKCSKQNTMVQIWALAYVYRPARIQGP